MASLNLVPNPLVILVQSGFFLASYVVVKHFYVVPYQKLRARRIAATVGSKDNASEILKSNEESAERIRIQLNDAMKNARQIVDEAKKKAASKRESLLEAAEKDAELTLSSLRGELKANLETERKAIPQVVEALGNKFFEKLLN